MYEGWKNTLSLLFSHFMVKNCEKGECTSPLWYFILSKLMQAVYCVRYFSIFFCRQNIYLRTKAIQIKPYTICSSLWLGLEAERHSHFFAN